MSELFESLQYPLPPSSSPSTISRPLKTVGGPLRGSQGDAKTSQADWGQQAQSSKTGLHQLRQQQHPRTPFSKAHTVSAASHFYEEHLFDTTPSFAPSASSFRQDRPDHIFWQATPSPSQQIRQNGWQKYLTSNHSPTLPLGTQAFRDELLHQGASSAAIRSKQSLTTGGPGEDLMTPSNKSACTATTSTASTSAMTRKFSRRISRRSTVAVGDASVTTDKSQGGEGMQQLLADLNQHLQNHENGVDDAEEESLVEELDRVFSSQRDISKSPSVGKEGRDRQLGNAEVTAFGAMQPELAANVEPSSSSSREWSRTKSAPAVTSSPRQNGRTSMAKVHSANVSTKDGMRARASLIKRLHSPSPHPRSTDSDCSAEEETTCSASPSAVASESRNGKHLTRGKTRSSVSPPKKWEGRRTPRIGLSRHSIGASQISGSLQSGPAAPFKRPTRASHVVPQRCATKRVDTIVIDDSDEEKQQQKADPIRRTSPRKKTTPNEVQPPSRTCVPAAKVEKKETEEDTSFDTSMDESMLCEAVDQAEARASQEAFQASQISAQAVKKSRLPSIGDDSFEMASSDNEAIVSAMEAKGW